MKTHNQKGELTAYGLSCGYLERNNAGTLEVKLTKEHGIYFVSLYDLENSVSVCEGTYPFEKLQDARVFQKHVLSNPQLFLL